MSDSDSDSDYQPEEDLFGKAFTARGSSVPAGLWETAVTGTAHGITQARQELAATLRLDPGDLPSTSAELQAAIRSQIQNDIYAGRNKQIPFPDWHMRVPSFRPTVRNAVWTADPNPARPKHNPRAPPPVDPKHAKTVVGPTPPPARPRNPPPPFSPKHAKEKPR